MLWQPSLPEKYLRASADDLAREIGARRQQLGGKLVILGHHYQTDEIIRHADFAGDSLKLSQIAARVAKERDAKWVVFCGVHFMAESADMLTPEHVEVILPDLSAGCSMADMAQHDDTLYAWDALHRSLQAQGWKGRVIPITYVNSSAAIKAFVGEHGGACCTSSNAMEVLRWALTGGSKLLNPGEQVKVLFLPDQHLGRNTASACGIDVHARSCVYDPRLTHQGHELGGMDAGRLVQSQIILWAGHCSVHKLFRPEHCDQVRAQDAKDGTTTTIIVHPECCKEVVDKSDLSGSTEKIIQTIQSGKPGSRWAVGTEVHLVNRLARQAQERGVHVRILSECQCLCTTMFRIDQPHLLWVLDHLAGVDGPAKVVNAIKVHPQVREKALKALERMLALTGGAGRASGAHAGAVD